MDSLNSTMPDGVMRKVLVSISIFIIHKQVQLAMHVMVPHYKRVMHACSMFLPLADRRTTYSLLLLTALLQRKGGLGRMSLLTTFKVRLQDNYIYCRSIL